MGKIIKKHGLALVFALGLIILDQISKYLTWTNLKLGESVEVIPSFFYFSYVINKGAAFSFLAKQSQATMFLGIISLIFSFLILVFMLKQKDKFDIFALSLALAGCVGNGIDRWFYGGVVDMLDFRFFSFHYPVFNLADSFICLALATLLYKLIKKEAGNNEKS